jgi:hypothetical protein
MLEDLSSISQTEHERTCLWLQEYYITPFGHIHTSDGLVMRSTEGMNMSILVYTIWIQLKGEMARGDVSRAQVWNRRMRAMRAGGRGLSMVFRRHLKLQAEDVENRGRAVQEWNALVDAQKRHIVSGEMEG